MRKRRIHGRLVVLAEQGSGGGQPPDVIQILPDGRTDTQQGGFLLDEEASEIILREWADRRNDMVIDYEHQTLFGDEAPAAGWITDLEYRPGEGLYATVEWTDRAAEYLRNREYRYLSPVFVMRPDDDRVVRIINAALTNQPAIDGMQPVVAKQDNQQQQHQREEEHTMKKLLEMLGLTAEATEAQAIEALGGVQAIAAKAREALGLDKGATPDAVAEAAYAMKQPAVPEGIRTALGLNDGVTVSQAEGTIHAMRQGAGSAEEMGARIHRLEGELAERRADDMVALAMKEGKITPANRDWARDYAAKDPEGFQAFAAKAPVVMPQGEMMTGEPGDPAGGPDAVQRQVNKMMGVSSEKFAEYGPRKEDG